MTVDLDHQRQLGIEEVHASDEGTAGADAALDDGQGQGGLLDALEERPLQPALGPALPGPVRERRFERHHAVAPLASPALEVPPQPRVGGQAVADGGVDGVPELVLGDLRDQRGHPEEGAGRVRGWDGAVPDDVSVRQVGCAVDQGQR